MRIPAKDVDMDAKAANPIMNVTNVKQASSENMVDVFVLWVLTMMSRIILAKNALKIVFPVLLMRTIHAIDVLMVIPESSVAIIKKFHAENVMMNDAKNAMRMDTVVIKRIKFVK
jgi:hypothetical protein